MTARNAGMSAITVVVLALFLLIAPRVAESADPNALWRIVHTLCVTDMRVSGNPAPCTRVDLAGRYAVLKDIRGATQLLLIPTDRITGIESPALLGAEAPNYFAEAWDARPLFQARAGVSVPREDIALAINSVYGRSQEQLHIHIDCVRLSVKAALAAHADSIGRRWTRLTFPLSGRHYWAMRLDGDDLAGSDPFKLLAEQPAARADMGRYTLAAIPISFHGRPGFVLLSDRADIMTFDQGTAEELQDHSCRVLHPQTSAG